MLGVQNPPRLSPENAPLLVEERGLPEDVFAFRLFSFERWPSRAEEITLFGVAWSLQGRRIWVECSLLTPGRASMRPELNQGKAVGQLRADVTFPDNTCHLHELLGRVIDESVHPRQGRRGPVGC